MKQYDVFISHSSKDAELAKHIANCLAQHNFTTWISYDKIDGGEDYSIIIPDAIKNSTVFLILLSNYSVSSTNVAKELSIVNNALNRNIGRTRYILPIIISECDVEPLEYFLTNVQILDRRNDSAEAQTEAIIKKIESKLYGTGEVPSAPSSSTKGNFGIDSPLSPTRTENKYFDASNTNEVRRLSVQNDFFRKFDQKIYDEFLQGKEDLVILDVGSNDGSSLLSRIGTKSEVKKIICLEYDETVVNESNEKYPNDFIHFYQVDVESPTFSSRLQEILGLEGCEQVDVIHISMLLLHLKKPLKLLRVLRNFLKPGGHIFIKDIDDGMSICYPDPEGYIKTSIEYLSKAESAGYRHNGRQVYTLLKNLKFNDVHLALSGIPTCELTLEEKEALYQIYFDGCIHDDLEYMAKKYPDSKERKDMLAYFDEHEDEIQEYFFDDAFFFILGVVIFIGTK